MSLIVFHLEQDIPYDKLRVDTGLLVSVGTKKGLSICVSCATDCLETYKGDASGGKRVSREEMDYAWETL